MESLTQQQSASRVVSHNKITDLTNGFKLENEHSFTIFVVKKSNINGSYTQMRNTSTSVVINSIYTADVLKGKIGQFILFKDTISQQAVNDLYNSGNGVFYSDID